MNLKRMWAVFVARNHEFFRDREALGWNFLFPFLIVAGFAIVFDNNNRAQFKVGVFPVSSPVSTMGTSHPPVTFPAAIIEGLDLPARFKETRYLDFVFFKSFDQGLDRLRHHKIDILIENSSLPRRYWISESSPKGYVAEKIFRESWA